jgi:hypothetical protein
VLVAQDRVARPFADEPILDKCKDRLRKHLQL